MKKGQSTSARNSSSARAITARRWDRISPDLTTNDPEKQKQEESGGVTVDNSAAEMHTTIYSIRSRRRTGRSSGWAPTTATCRSRATARKTWTNVVGNVQRTAPELVGIAGSRPAASMRATAYATFDRHTYGDMAPYAYKTTDYGKTWTSLNVAGERREGICARHQGGSGRSAVALCRHRIRTLDLG